MGSDLKPQTPRVRHFSFHDIRWWSQELRHGRTTLAIWKLWIRKAAVNRWASPSPPRSGVLLLYPPLPHTPFSETKRWSPSSHSTSAKDFYWTLRQVVLKGGGSPRTTRGSSPFQLYIFVALDFLHTLQAKAMDCNRLNGEEDVRIQALLLSRIFRKIWNRCQTGSLFSPKVLWLGKYSYFS